MGYFSSSRHRLPSGVEDVDVVRAEDLIRAGQVKVLDVREPGEHITSHIPGSILVPIGHLARRVGELDPEAHWLVHCEHGIRSMQAVRFLHSRGFGALYHLAGGLQFWSGARASHAPLFEDPRDLQPSGWLLEHLSELPRGRALDVACGRGRNALILAYSGWEVDAIDRDGDRLEMVEARAKALNLPVRARNLDLETAGDPFEPERYDLVLVIYYLQRDLFRGLKAAVRPGGAIVYETFTREQARYGRPSKPDHLLEPGELESRFADWEILAAREGDVGPEGKHSNRALASIVAVRPPEEL